MIFSAFTRSPPHARAHTYRRDIILVDKPETFLLPTVAGHHDDDDDDDGDDGRSPVRRCRYNNNTHFGERRLYHKID